MKELEKFQHIELNYSDKVAIDGGCFFEDLWTSIKEEFIEGFNDGSGANC